MRIVKLKKNSQLQREEYIKINKSRKGRRGKDEIEERKGKKKRIKSGAKLYMRRYKEIE